MTASNQTQRRFPQILELKDQVARCLTNGGGTSGGTSGKRTMRPELTQQMKKPPVRAQRPLNAPSPSMKN